jgi:uncharacterized protein (TIGR03066 family)
MKRLHLILIGALCLLVAACEKQSLPSSGSKPVSSLKDQIVGNWQEGQDADAEVMEFAKDGTVTVTMGPIKMKGKYQVENDESLNVEMENPLDPKKTKALKLKASLVKDELTLTNDEEKNEAKKVKKFQRK